MERIARVQFYLRTKQHLRPLKFLTYISLTWNVFTKASHPSARNTCGDTKSLITVTSEGVKRLLKKLTTGKASGSGQLKKYILAIDLSVTSQILATFFLNIHWMWVSFLTSGGQQMWSQFSKKGSRGNSVNFKLISVTFISCKLLEHIVLSNI